MEFQVLCLQEHPEFIDQSVELLNSQWPRSKTARLRSFEQGSSDGFPTSLVLIDKQYGRGKEKVLAHSKISPVPSNDKICFVESVVVASDLRGKGLGRLIMKETEEFVLSKGITTIYLTTHDQQLFYEKLGYTLSEPVVVFGGRCQSLNKIVERNMEKLQLNEADKIPMLKDSVKSKDSVYRPWPEKSRNSLPSPVPPPPPPLISPSTTTRKSNHNIEILRPNTEIKLTMKKVLL